MVKYIFLFFLGFIFSANLFAQETQKIDNKRVELQKLKYEINRLETELTETLKEEKKSINLIENFNKQNLLLNKLITSLRNEELEKQKHIAETEDQIKNVQSKINRLKDSYAKYLIYQYKYGKDYEWSAILGSGSFNQAIIRFKYFRRISEQQKKDLSALEENKSKLVSLQKDLMKEQAEKRSIAARKEQEEKQLAAKISDKKNTLRELRGDKTAIQKNIELKKEAEGEIKNLITKLIVEERRKKAEEEKQQKLLAEANKSKPAVKEKKSEEKVILGNELVGAEKAVIKELNTSKSSSRLIQKGSLLWPITGGTIIRNAGENRNSKLNTVTLNYGIDIKAGNDLNVYSVTAGEISMINWVPGYGSVIIITHRNGFRSVYGHLSEIFVKEGDKIEEGALIGKVGESLEGFVLHFELWIERNYQNPEIWLSRK